MGITDLARAVAQELNTTQVMARDVIDVVLGTIAGNADAGEVVRITGFGTFQNKTSKARTCRNPQTNEPVEVPAKTKLTFKASK